MRTYIITLILLVIFGVDSKAKITPNSLFSNHAVLQQGVVVPVWGTAYNEVSVTVDFDNQKISTQVVDGKWWVELKPLKAGGPYDMHIYSDNDSVEINDILVGEVWVCSGQSNMERQLGPRYKQPLIVNWEQERAQANYPQIRQYHVGRKYSFSPVEDANAQWVVCSQETVINFSAIGYFFAQNLHQKLGVPIGLLFSAKGGTSAENWVSEVTISETPKLASLVKDYDKAIRKKQKENYPTGLYNGMISPLQPFAIKGVIWYQGESDTKKAEQYQILFPALIESWRKAWKQNHFPFLFVQLAPYKYTTPEIREAQLLTLAKTKNTAMVVTTDCGDPDDIHPANKKTVGERLALAARAIAYKEKIEYSGPIYSSKRLKGRLIILSFIHKGKGLSCKGDRLTGFEIAGEDKQFVPALAIIKHNKVYVSHEKIKKPLFVRYGWSNVPEINLYNKDGFPASPFRTDSY